MLKKYNIDLNKQLELTGEYSYNIDDDNYSYIHLILNKKQYNEIILNNDLKNVIKEVDCDYLSVEEYGEIEFIHCTTNNNIPSIQEKGIIAEKTWIYLFGTGLHGVENTSLGVNSLRKYMSQSMNTSSNVYLVGKYKGRYLRSIYHFDENNIEYIVLKKDCVNYSNILEIRETLGA